MIERKQGIILNAMDYRENHRILYLLTPTGKTSVLVPKAKKFKTGLINDTQNLNLIEFEEVSSSINKARNLEVIDYFYEIKNDIKKMAIASYALELVYRFIDTNIHMDVLFNLLLNFFMQLRKRSDLQTILLEFRIKMLYFLGIQPNFKSCIHCGEKTDLVGLSIQYGAVECKKHQSNDNIGETATEIIKLFYYDKSFAIAYDNSDVISYLSSIIDQYYDLHFKERLKSLEMINSLNI